MENEELEQQQMEAFKESQGAVPTEVVTAFLIMQHPNGQWDARADFSLPLALQRAATLDDFVAGCENVKLGAQIRQTAISTMIMMEERANQMSQRMQEEAERKRAQEETDRISRAIGASLRVK